MAFPVGDELNELGYNHMFKDMFSSIEERKKPEKLFMMDMWSMLSSMLLINQPKQNCGNPWCWTSGGAEPAYGKTAI